LSDVEAQRLRLPARRGASEKPGRRITNPPQVDNLPHNRLTTCPTKPAWGLQYYETDPTLHDPYHLQRFVDAQSHVYDQVCSELRNGDKRGHWIWFIFPQIKGLGFSATANRFAISSREEAAAYLEHPILGPRLRECTRLVTLVKGRSLDQIFGYPDDLKFRSCMTLFAHVAADKQIFLEALEKYCGGEFDGLTLERL
jgi:uncharacterized protein (DUF1810 family)